jgi:zinc-ribbon domain
LASQEPPASEPITFCAHCGKPIEVDARFCRFCGKAQAERGVPSRPGAGSAPPRSASGRQPTAGDGLEERLRQLFPRHAFQDDLMHIGSIAAFFMLVIGFVLGFFFAYSWLALNFLLAGIGLLLFLILRESTLATLRERGPATPSRRPEAPRTTDLPAEAATTQSTPVRQAPPPAPPPPPPPSRPAGPRQ